MLSAQQALTGETSNNSSLTTVSLSEQALLSETGSNEVDSHIRQVINREMRMRVEKDKTIADRIFFWRKKASLNEQMIDSDTHNYQSERSSELGKSVNVSDVSPVEQKEKGFFSKVWSLIF
jgi:hypothetical protein